MTTMACTQPCTTLSPACPPPVLQVRGNEARVERHAVATVCLRKRALPDKPPPRIIVLTGAWAEGGP